MESSRVKIAKQFIDHFATLDTQILKTILSENYHHEFAPSSLNPPGPFNKQGFFEHHAGLDTVLAGFPVTAKEYIDSESSNSVTVWATSRAVFRDDAKDASISDWEYEGEYIFIFTFDPTGEKIVRTIEFLDSKATADKLMVLMKRARENKNKS
ncbi:hypothetical protein BGW36DRAFT_385023 [Talaromyces proteolyticus]|uniref:SnoaL-like domain-containing protein n=1 Tax=Talaromyces proteolyticus TaxID=1131652 RepID=A0AAD4KJV7_9EURO|nr:uncharacterized protein BGW36DRAFT_385023 [Talaromyces proteolyticus]KAH8692713.1 hypothetical protein BGW36DRAFT_385023 [Talaromyces proteolyticus]